MASKVGVSAVVLTMNEAENISYCLDSLKWCDEVIVVDSSSDDGTIEIAENKGAKVIQEEAADGRFDHLRNYGVEKASNEWIFVLDADEICPKELADKLLEEARKGEFDAFNIPRENYLMDDVKLSSIQPDYQMRFHKKDAVSYGQEIHTFLEVDEESEIKDLNPEKVSPILHFDIQTVSEYIEIINKYTSIRAQNEGQNHSFTRILLQACWNLIYYSGRNFIYKKGYRKPHQTALTVFMSFIGPFLLYFKKWQISEKGTDEEVLDKINDIREKEVSKYDEEDLK
jgi:glycosyltransferase involved in cell wall biosynthesis